MTRAASHATPHLATEWACRFAIVLLAFAVRALGAQDSVVVHPAGWMVGGSLGMLGFGAQTASLQLTTLGMHFTHARVGAIGADISIGTIPRLLADGAVVLGARAGVAMPIRIAPGMLALPSAGLTAIAAASGGRAASLTGFNLGAALVVGTGPVGFRSGVTWHRLNDMPSGFWLAEVGITTIPCGRRR